LETKTIALKRMNTKEDADKVSKVLHDVWGVRKVEVNFENSEVTFSYDEKAASFIDFEQAVADSGYEIQNEEGDIKQ
jgi:copper chaperone